MQEQNFKNHTQMVPGYHYFTTGLILILLVGAIINVFTVPREQIFTATLFCLVPVILISLFWYARVFALKAQDRAIRAEENLRYFVLTGKTFPPGLRISQIIALRFAPDNELVELAEKAAQERLSSKSIKMAINNWKADWYRV